jgi:hypothetical protein
LPELPTNTKNTNNMGREIRKVPAHWEHPKTTRWDYRLQKDVECYKPLYDDRDAALKSFAADIEKMGLAEAIDYHGGGPKSDDYVDFEGKEPTWWQVYETVSEGTPVTPPFATREELVEYLVENGDFWDQNRRKEGRSSMPCDPWSRENAVAFVMGSGWAPSMVIDNGKIMSGVEALSSANAPALAQSGGGKSTTKESNL